MSEQKALTERELRQFLEEYGGDRLKREILAFWGRHPQAKFSLATMACALDCRKLDMERSLRAMVNAGLVDTYCYNGQPFYSLTADEQRRRPIL